MAGECSYSDSSNPYEKQDMRREKNEDKEGVCTNSISNLAHYVPLDLTLDILTRLPANSLKRFQCVSKEWLSTIGDQGFIDSFSSVSQTRSRFLVAVRSAENHVFLLSSSQNETETCTTPLATNPQVRSLHGCLVDYVYATSLQTNLDMEMSGLLVDLVHCSSIHGFIGLSHPGRRFTVCNPSTRQVITLPDMEASSGRKEGVYMYLGYDPVGNEYKALCSTAFYGKRHQEHKVLTLGKRGNLSWRDISGRRTPCYMVVTNGICINGMVYYIGMTLGLEKTKLVFRFDVKGERMRYIRPPLPVKALGSLINFKGKLGVAYHLSYDPLRRFDILVLDDLEKGMWSCQRIVFNPLMLELSGKIQLKILGVNKMGEIIFGPLKLPRKHEPLYIFFYNIKMSGDRFIRRIKLEGFEEFGCNHTGDLWELGHEFCNISFLYKSPMATSPPPPQVGRNLSQTSCRWFTNA